MQTNLALDTYLESTARWSALTDPKRYSNDDVQRLVPTFHSPAMLPLRSGFVPDALESGPEAISEINQRVDRQLAAITNRMARLKPVRNRTTAARKAWKTRRANTREVNRQGTNIGKHHA